MIRRIKKVAVLGSGVMGSRIACLFANIGVESLLLDIIPTELNAAEIAKGMDINHAAFRNRIVNDALQNTIKSNPAALFLPSFANRISTGNFDDNLKDIHTCDWVIEVVVENLVIKQHLFERIEPLRKPGTLITSNTSGIPIHLMTKGRSEDFIKHFCGTHFFNPPRYLPLLEIIPTPQTDVAVVDFLMDYGKKFLGKTTVLCKDTPAFIANRIGVYALMEVFHASDKLGLSIESADKLSGPVIGHAKSATFRTADVVGIDTLIKVAKGLEEGLVNDEQRERFKLTNYLLKIDENKWYGDKSKQGFYKKTKNEKGETEILSLDLKTFEYKQQKKEKFATLELTKTIDDLKTRLPVLLGGTDVASEFYRLTFYPLFAYVSNRIPEIADNIYSIDEAVCAGFGWELGPFETWDALGVRDTLEKIKQAGYKPALWVEEMLASGITSFYKIAKGKKYYYSLKDKIHKQIPGTDNFIILDHIRSTQTIWKNSGTVITDLGDGIINLEFRTKMNTIGSEVIQGLNKAIDLAEQDFNGLVIGNNGVNFSAGANLAMLLMFAADQEYDEIDLMVRVFQKAMMRVRYSSIPVVTAPHHLTLGGGCELNLHADAVQMFAETYIGLVEFGVGLIPAGGGTKEMTMRAADVYQKGDIELNNLSNYYMNIAMAKVSTSAYEAKDMHIHRAVDGISMNLSMQIADAKNKAISLSDKGYTQSAPRKNIRVQGKNGMALFYAGSESMLRGKYISEHDKKISQKLANIMCGGELSYPQDVSEQYLLDLEREAFLSLCGERKTLERIQHTLKTGKPLRN
ncbi:MAG: 3-hydroxyacyl-CoA dehydrogenase [Bacteroidia bacterium]|nr:3-hydroxyacyl-CoA dehydrogenase [Bacteroidia bacterium]